MGWLPLRDWGSVVEKLINLPIFQCTVIITKVTATKLAKIMVWGDGLP